MPDSSTRRRSGLGPGRESHFTKAEDQSLNAIIASFRAKYPTRERLRWDRISLKYNRTAAAGRERAPTYLAAHYRKICKDKARKNAIDLNKGGASSGF
jgi:hypothetical protein